MGDKDDSKDIFSISDFILPHEYFVLPKLT